ncbi:putative RNA-directed DNA polymerase from transposon BS [Trichonephila clavipes]|nr:putative RNA-directed DNA polymerase from transposon BS [Trichonephila clavipes]
MFWNFKKAKWDSYRDSVDIKLSSTPFANDLEENWKNFRTIILDNAKAFIPRRNIRRHVPFFTHHASSLKPLHDKRNELHKSLGDGSLNLRAEIKIHVDIKLVYTQLKRSRLKEMCESLDCRAANAKLWRIIKDINREQEQSEERNSVTDINGQIFPDDKAAANAPAVYYQESSKLGFTIDNIPILRKAKNIIHGCRSTDVGDQELSRAFTSTELLLAMVMLCLTKSPLPDGIFGQMLENLGQLGKQRLVDLISLSWKTVRHPADWKRTTLSPIKKAGKKTWAPKNFRPIALTSIACKIMEKIILIRIQYFLNSKNLLPCEQFGYRRGHSTIDQILFFCQSVRDAQNLKLTHHTTAVLLDLTKAFVAHEGQSLLSLSQYICLRH